MISRLVIIPIKDLLSSSTGTKFCCIALSSRSSIFAPAFTGQFGDNINARNLKAALEELGFSRDQVYTTLELRMKCGVGKCGRCNIGTKYVCKDGPVFRCDELDEMPAEY